MDYKIVQSDNDVIKSILKNRGITNEQINNWLEADSNDWEDPSNYPNIHEAYVCLMSHIECKDDIYVIVYP